MDEQTEKEPEKEPEITRPYFKLGEEIVVKGVRFAVERINRSNIVLRPVPKTPKGKSSEVLNALQSVR
jgi:hypothetical protein